MAQCKQMVWSQGTWRRRQCFRDAWKDGYCKQHHPDTVKKRDEERAARYEAKQKQSPWYKLEIACKEIRRLKAKIRRLEKKLEK